MLRDLKLQVRWLTLTPSQLEMAQAEYGLLSSREFKTILQVGVTLPVTMITSVPCHRAGPGARQLQLSSALPAAETQGEDVRQKMRPPACKLE